MLRLQKEVERLQKKEEQLQKEVEKLTDLKKEVDSHGTPSYLPTEVTNMQWSLDDNEMALANANTIEEDLSSGSLQQSKLWGKQRESNKEKVDVLKKVCNDVVGEGIKGIFDGFQNACNQAEMLCLGIQIP